MRVRQQSVMGQAKKYTWPEKEIFFKFYSSILRGFSDATAILTTSGKVIAANTAFMAFFDRADEAAETVVLADLFTETSRDRLKHCLQVAAGGAPSEARGAFQSLTGKNVATEALFNPVPAPTEGETLVLMQLRSSSEEGQVSAGPNLPSDAFPDKLLSFDLGEQIEESSKKLSALIGAGPDHDELERYLGLARQGQCPSFYQPGNKRRRGIKVGGLCTEVRFFSDAEDASRMVWAAVRNDVPCPSEIDENRRLAYQDLLTGLANRRAFLGDLEDQLEAAHAEKGQHLAVYCIDLDEFKKVNDLGGHAAGDQMLGLVGNSLGSQVSKSGRVARIGGDEFAAYDWVEDEQEALRIGRRICEVLSSISLEQKNRLFTIGSSIGVSILPADEDLRRTKVADLLQHADSICLRGKRSGGGTIHLERFPLRKVEALTTSDTQDDHLARPEVAPSKGRAPQDLKLEDLELHAMPIVRLADMKPVGQEVLLRQKDEDGLEVSPRNLLSMADRSGWIAQVDTWIMDQVLDSVAASNDRITVGVNVSAAAAGSSSFRDMLQARLQGDPLLAGRLCVEISERDLLREPDLMEGFLRFSTELGFQTALDNFSGNWAALDRLAVLQFNWLKMKPVVTKPVIGQRRKMVILSSMVNALQELGIQVVAKHVEGAQELEALREIGIWGGQGFHLGPPRLWSGSAIERFHS